VSYGSLNSAAVACLLWLPFGDEKVCLFVMQGSINHRNVSFFDGNSSLWKSEYVISQSVEPTSSSTYVEVFIVGN